MAQKQKTILIVEDETDTAEMFSEMLRLSGYQPLKTHAGDSAITLLARQKPDALLLDLMMPGNTGLDVLRYVRGNPSLKAMPVIVVSAKGLPTDIKEGIDAGATEYLTKPVSYQDLKLAVDHSLHSPAG